MTSRSSLLIGALALFLAGCGGIDGTEESVTDTIVRSSDYTPGVPVADDGPVADSVAPIDNTASAPESVAPDGLRLVASFDEMSGIWMPTEVNGEPVDSAALGAYLQITGSEGSARLIGYDGCNRVGGRPIEDGALLEQGRLGEFEQESTMEGCDDSVAVLFGTDALLSISGDGAELFADGLPVSGSIRYDRVESVPVDPRIAVRQADQEAEEAARIAEEQAQDEAVDQANDEARDRIRTELPDARARWAAAGIPDYTLRFENASLANDPSFPTRRPVGGVWEIDVVDGVALENEWSESVLGDTVEDWFAYVESQLDSHHLSVQFDTELGYPLLIDSQPLDDAVVDQSELTAWLVRSEVVVSN